MISALRQRTFDSGPVPIAYAAGPPGGRSLVFLHGVAQRWQSFADLLPVFSRNWRVFALDLRGHGRSGRAPGRYRVVDYAEDVRAFIAGVAGEPSVLVGHSLGALAAIAAAARDPATTRALVLEDPPLYARDWLPNSRVAEVFAAWRLLAASDLGADELASALHSRSESGAVEAVQAQAAALKQLDPEVLTSVLQGSAFEHFEPDAMLRRIARPVLVMRGALSLGSQLSAGEAARAASVLPDCRLVEVLDAGHAIHAQQPAACVRAIADFLDAVA